MKPIYLQLYSVRDSCAENLEETLNRVKAMGYDGIETAGLHGRSPQEFKNLVDAIGLKHESGFFPIKDGALSDSIETAKELELSYMLYSGFGADAFADETTTMATIEIFQKAASEIKAAGMTPLMHNHSWEFQSRSRDRRKAVPDSARELATGTAGNEELVFDYIRDNVAELNFCLDCYWCHNFGKFDPVEIITKNCDRIPTIHIKDGMFERGESFLALGDGKENIPEIIEAANYPELKFITVEIDRCETDMLQTVERSINYLRKLN